eukprot:TRINITY_DN12447_c0_g1_i3.p1 TRINITY_DN12447_c0_g1~~TRINITY_DN12447_c0_g1_i3.p1  ORF type:complete len:292 (-),score=27.23 TRINITY_DN12447_c0_g1_i3:129-1004(-)
MKIGSYIRKSNYKYHPAHTVSYSQQELLADVKKDKLTGKPPLTAQYKNGKNSKIRKYNPKSKDERTKRRDELIREESPLTNTRLQTTTERKSMSSSGKYQVTINPSLPEDFNEHNGISKQSRIFMNLQARMYKTSARKLNDKQTHKNSKPSKSPPTLRLENGMNLDGKDVIFSAYVDFLRSPPATSQPRIPAESLKRNKPRWYDQRPRLIINKYYRQNYKLNVNNRQTRVKLLPLNSASEVEVAKSLRKAVMGSETERAEGKCSRGKTLLCLKNYRVKSFKFSCFCSCWFE